MKGSSENDMVERVWEPCAVCYKRLLLSLSISPAICCALTQTPLYLLLGWRRLIASVHGCISARCCIHPQPSSSSFLTPPPNHPSQCFPSYIERQINKSLQSTLSVSFPLISLSLFISLSVCPPAALPAVVRLG